jgi:hypothetical protein
VPLQSLLGSFRYWRACVFESHGAVPLGSGYCRECFVAICVMLAPACSITQEAGATKIVTPPAGDKSFEPPNPSEILATQCAKLAASLSMHVPKLL